MKRKKKATAPRCPYCGSVAILRSAEGIYHSHSKDTMLYVCKKYPICDSYVRVHPGTSIPMGHWPIKSCGSFGRKHTAILTSYISRAS